MKDWIPVKTEPMTEEEIKLYADDYELNPGDPEAVTYRNPMPEDGEVIWITTKKGEVLKTECVNDKGIYWLVDHDWSQVLAWMPVEIPKPYRAPDPEGYRGRLIRCSDCKYFEPSQVGWGRCTRAVEILINGTDFCSFGERKNDTD